MSNASENPETSKAGHAELDAHVKEMESSLFEMVVTHRKSVKVARFISILVPLFVLLYLSFIYSFLKDFVQPTSLVETVEYQIAQTTPAVLRLIEEKTPVLAEEGLVLLIENIPDLRLQAEEAVLKFSDEHLNQMFEKVYLEVRGFVRDHKPTLARLKGDEGAVEHLKEQIQVEFNDIIVKQGMKTVFGQSKRMLQELHKKLIALRCARGPLTEEQELEKRVVVLCKILLSHQAQAVKGSK